MKEVNTYELTEFNLKNSINLEKKCGLIKIARSDDGKLILLCDSSYDLISQDGPSQIPIANVDAALGFVLDIGIRKEKMLTRGNGYYCGSSLVRSVQSVKEVSSSDFDLDMMEKIVTTIDLKFHSNYPPSKRRALRFNHLIAFYNQARLLYPNFYNSSYLSLIRILDSLGGGEGAYDFALWCSFISGKFNKEVYTKVCNIGALKLRVQLVESHFTKLLSKAPTREIENKMRKLSKYRRFVFVCLYASYQYRSTFVHQGFPFPKTVIERSSDKDNGLAYLNSTVSISHMQIFRPSGYQEGDDLDIHAAIRLIRNRRSRQYKYTYQDYKDFFKLLPSWHWMKSLVRFALVKEIDKLLLLA